MPAFFAIFFISPAALVLLGVAAVLYRRERRRRWLAFGLGVLMSEALALLGASSYLHYWDGYSFDAATSDAELIGTWQLNEQTLTLNGDGTFVESDGTHGHWKRAGLCFEVDVLEKWTCIHHGAELLVLPIPDEDPDDWNRFRALSRR